MALCEAGHATHVSGPFSDSQCCLQWGRETQEMEREGEWTESSNTESVFSPYWLKSSLVFSAAISHKYTFTHSLGNGQENWNCRCSWLPVHENLPNFAHWSSPIPNFPSWVCLIHFNLHMQPCWLSEAMQFRVCPPCSNTPDSNDQLVIIPDKNLFIWIRCARECLNTQGMASQDLNSETLD